MFDMAPDEIRQMDGRLEPALAWAEKRLPEAEQLAADAARLMSCTEDRLDSYGNAGFLTRCWHKLSGKQGDIARANQRDLAEMQRHAWRYLEILNERDLLLAHSVLSIKNQLLALASLESETRMEVARLAERIGRRLRDVEGRVAGLEVSMEIHSWLLTIDTVDYYEELPPCLRLLRVVSDFHSIKPDGWNAKELKYLQKALKEVGLPWRSEVTLREFVGQLLGEMEGGSVAPVRGLISGGTAADGEPIPPVFALEHVSVPSFAALSRIAIDYEEVGTIIRTLDGDLRIGSSEALRKVMGAKLAHDGLELDAPLPMRDLAVELLGAARLARRLFDRRGEAHEVVRDELIPMLSRLSLSQRVEQHLREFHTGDHMLYNDVVIEMTDQLDENPEDIEEAIRRLQAEGRLLSFYGDGKSCLAFPTKTHHQL